MKPALCWSVHDPGLHEPALGGKSAPISQKEACGHTEVRGPGKGEPEWNDEEDERWEQTNLDANPGDGTSCVAVRVEI